MAWGLRTLQRTAADPAVVLIRVMVGGVFFSEGCQKFLFADQLGVGRFLAVGLPHPEVLAPLVGVTEIICGAAVLCGLYARVTVVPLIAVISVALVSTKVAILLDRGFWAMMHEGRTDLCMLLGGLFIVLRGAGAWSIDRAMNGDAVGKS